MGFSRTCGLLAIVFTLLPSQLFAQYFPRGPVPMCMGPGGMRPCGMIPLPGFRPPPPMFRPGPPVIYPPPLSYYPPPPPIVRPRPAAPPPNVILSGPVPVAPSVTAPWRRMDSTPVAVASGRLGGAQQCAAQTGQENTVNVPAFVLCTQGALVLDQQSMAIVNCAQDSGGDKESFGKCAADKVISSNLSPDQRKLVDCAGGHSDDEDDFAGCLEDGLLGDQLNGQQRAVLDCAKSNDLDSEEFATCAGESILGGNLPPNAKAAIGCAAQSEGDAAQFAGCATDKFLNLDLTPEQQIGIECVVESGGQPYAAAGCAATRLTARELDKCAEHGIGGEDGCFGDNNDLTGKNGFVVRHVGDLANAVMGGHESLLNHPGQILGGPNSVPNQILSGLPSPPPVEVGYRWP
jgi:hypothetical protein